MNECSEKLYECLHMPTLQFFFPRPTGLTNYDQAAGSSYHSSIYG